MARCKHRNACDVDRNGFPCSTWDKHPFRRWCWDCSDHIGMGPSNDDSDAVRVEIRAAELAAGIINPAIINPAMNPAVAHAATCGYHDKQTPFVWGCGWGGLERAYEAGYLARQIVTHGE